MTARDRRVKRVALTGGIATGKSYVRQAFEKLGVPTMDADTLAREAVAPGSPGLRRIVERFGPEVLSASGDLDRRRVAAVVFEDAAARRDLEAIVHPYVIEASERWFSALDPATHPFAVYDIPLLFETGRQRDFDTVVVVAAEPATQLRRLRERDGLPETDARRRIAAQLPISEKVARADYVIRTDGSFEDTERQVSQLAKSLTTSHQLPTTD